MIPVADALKPLKRRKLKVSKLVTVGKGIIVFFPRFLVRGVNRVF